MGLSCRFLVWMSVIDTHCHLDLLAEEGTSPFDALHQAAEAGLSAVVQIATNLASSQFNAELAKEWHSRPDSGRLRLYWTAGLHPENGQHHEELPELFALIRSHRGDDGFLGIGETGLDYFHTTEYIAEQQASLEQHLRLADELQLPVVLHTRDDRQYIPGHTQAMKDALDRVKAHRGVRGVLHCFTYSYEEAMPFVDLGWMVSFSGILTFKTSHTLHEAAARLPLECLMVETDAPFLSPAPHRGKPNLPAYVIHTLDFLAQLRHERNGEDPHAVRAKIRENSLAFLCGNENITPKAPGSGLHETRSGVEIH